MHWAEEKVLQQRGYFDLTSDVTGLVIKPVHADDQALYRCRVDFKSSPTRNVRIKLSVTGKNYVNFKSKKLYKLSKNFQLRFQM